MSLETRPLIHRKNRRDSRVSEVLDDAIRHLADRHGTRSAHDIAKIDYGDYLACRILGALSDLNRWLS